LAAPGSPEGRAPKPIIAVDGAIHTRTRPEEPVRPRRHKLIAGGTRQATRGAAQARQTTDQVTAHAPLPVALTRSGTAFGVRGGGQPFRRPAPGPQPQSGRPHLGQAAEPVQFGRRGSSFLRPAVRAPERAAWVDMGCNLLASGSVLTVCRPSEQPATGWPPGMKLYRGAGFRIPLATSHRGDEISRSGY
jgi:hypothetical protein